MFQRNAGCWLVRYFGSALHSAGLLSGEIEPYTDPLCSCLVRTSFLGRLEGTRFEGTYTTRGTAREYQSGGRWSAQRK